MSYTPQTWANGDIITATKLNNIESGVQSVSNSYTPTTWVNGDIITATKLNNIEQGIANAGGGSSDFSTATATITMPDYVIITFPSIFSDPMCCLPFQVTDVSAEPFQVVLYKGMAVARLDNVVQSISVTGDISYDSEMGAFFITGDGTITIS